MVYKFFDYRDMEAGALDYESLIDLNDLKPICYTSVRGLDCFILVDNLPIVSEDRVEKLKKALRVKFGNFGSIVENGIVIPYNKTSDVIQG